jgi:hypothetical protein
MFCTQCGNTVEEHAKFCSKCGSAVVAVQPAVAALKTAHDMNMHTNILAWLFIGTGVLLGLVALTVIFTGQLILRLPIPFPPDVPAGMPHFIGWITAMVGLGITCAGACVAAAGIGLLQYENWGRILTIIVSALLLFQFPVGTAIAVYAFWVLFSDEGRAHYKMRSAGTMA